MIMKNPEEFTDEDLLDNMGDMLEDILIHLNTKDVKSIPVINKHLTALQNNLVEACQEFVKTDEWQQDDLIDLASAAMLLATSMGIPPNDEETPATQTETSKA